MTVSGGTPTLTLNDGGVATYTGGSGTNTLTFTYTVGAGQNIASLAATARQPQWRDDRQRGRDRRQPVADRRLDPERPADRHHDADRDRSLTDSPTTGDLAVGKTVTLTLKLNEAVTVSGGTPTLTLNDGGIATYASGSGTNTLTFTYTVGAARYERRFAPRHGRQPQWRDGRQRGRDQRQPVADRRHRRAARRSTPRRRP